jgi:hypothetical protein
VTNSNVWLDAPVEVDGAAETMAADVDDDVLEDTAVLADVLDEIVLGSVVGVAVVVGRAAVVDGLAVVLGLLEVVLEDAVALEELLEGRYVVVGLQWGSRGRSLQGQAGIGVRTVTITLPLGRGRGR